MYTTEFQGLKNNLRCFYRVLTDLESQYAIFISPQTHHTEKNPSFDLHENN